MAAEKLEVEDFAALELKIEEIAAEKRAKFAAKDLKNEEIENGSWNKRNSQRWS